MLAEIICKECDQIIDRGSFDYTDRIEIGILILSMMSHYQSTGHTLIKLELTIEEIDTEGD